MFIRQDGKVFIQEGNKIVGVEIYTDNIVKVNGTETKLLDGYELYTATEIKKKYNIREDNPYIFTQEKKPTETKVVEQDVKPLEKGVDTDEPVVTTKKSARKPRSK